MKLQLLYLQPRANVWGVINAAGETQSSSFCLWFLEKYM